MGLKVKEEVLHVENSVGENTAQSVLQGTLELPASAPNIERVVWLKGSPFLTDVTIGEDKVAFDGYINMQFVYMSEASELEVAGYQVVPWQNAISFNDFVEVIGAENGMIAQPKIEVLAIDWELEPDQRTLNVDVLTQLSARVKQKEEQRAVTSASINPPKKLAINDVALHTQPLVKELDVQVSFQKTIELPNDSSIDKVLDLDLQPQITETKITLENIKIGGYLTCDVLYATEEGLIKSFLYDERVPFELVVPNSSGDQELVVEADLRVEAKADTNQDGTVLAVSGKVVGQVKLYQKNYTRAVLEITCSSGDSIEARHEKIKLDNLINEKTQQSSAQGVVEIPDNYPPMREIVKSWGCANVTEYRIDEDKVLVEGTISLEVAYLAHTDEEKRPLYCGVFRNAIPFQQVIALGGVELGMTALVDVKVKETRLDLINRETIEVDVSYRSTVKVMQPFAADVVVEALEVSPLEEDPPTITYIAVQKQDTLWKLAKRYHTSLDTIVAANSWLRERENQQILPGDKVCIPRR